MENNKQDKRTDIIVKLNKSIEMGAMANALTGFERAFSLADATKQLKDYLTTEYMNPIMELQNNKLGYKTDKPEGYEEKIVKNCLIEAVLTGVQVVGNQFNIIAGNCYITKEGFGYMLNRYPGLSWEIIPKLPRINAEGNSAAIVMEITWQLNGGDKHRREIDFPVKTNKFMGSDGVIGKATRKARAWLYNTVSGLEISDGDAGDVKEEKTATLIEKGLKVDYEALKFLFENKKSLMTPVDAANAQRIIDNKEEASYIKLKSQLEKL